ncbi:hypothetical protein HELRODRAFT_115835 [Helobdella robusta]|uniref:CRAL-TRIO domain-containing protein n=1 Tax=Helobdella robusta TaxID=6412 RepID=T1EGB1_HELRO|nr:hypothetical protein HELRODRAFT_115835 [Helobdella robusta]ESN92479.1 hypothetical protein HELRODRAFT_115835 [Helobdella robusta]
MSSASSRTPEIQQYNCTLSPTLIEKAEKELNEKAQWRDRDIQALRDMVVANKALKCPLDGGHLIKFLRARKFDYERAYNLLISYYTARANSSQYLKDLVPSMCKELLDCGITCMFPNKDSQGRRIMYIRPGKWNPASMPMMEILKVNMLSLEMVIKEEDTQVNGVICIANMSDMTMDHVKNFDRNYIKIMSSIIQDAFPMRFKGFHFINEPTVFGYLFSLVKPFLKEKIVQRLNFHGSSLDSLHKVFDKRYLPKELDGDLPPGDEIAQVIFFHSFIYFFIHAIIHLFFLHSVIYSFIRSFIHSFIHSINQSATNSCGNTRSWRTIRYSKK